MARIRSIGEARAFLTDYLNARHPLAADPEYVWSYGDAESPDASHAFLVRRKNETNPGQSMRIVYTVGPRGGVHASFSLADWQYEAIR